MNFVKVTPLKDIELPSKDGPVNIRRGTVIEMKVEKASRFIKAGILKEVCQSIQYDGLGVQPCGEGWTCPRCSGPGSKLKTVSFWSEKRNAWLEFTLPEKDLYDVQKVMEARVRAER